MYGLIIKCLDNTAYPPVYKSYRVGGNIRGQRRESVRDVAGYTKAQGMSRLVPDQASPYDPYAGLWVSSSTASDGDDAERIADFVRFQMNYPHKQVCFHYQYQLQGEIEPRYVSYTAAPERVGEITIWMERDCRETFDEPVIEYFLKSITTTWGEKL